MKRNTKQRLKDFANPEEKRVIKSIDRIVVKNYSKIIFNLNPGTKIKEIQELLDKFIITTIRYIWKIELENEHKYFVPLAGELITSSIDSIEIGKEILHKLKDQILKYPYDCDCDCDCDSEGEIRFFIKEMIHNPRSYDGDCTVFSYRNMGFHHDKSIIIDIFRKYVCWLFWKCHAAEELKNYLSSVIIAMCMDYVHKMEM